MFSMQFEPGVNIIVGNNDAGKTSILEAINLALTGQILGKSVFTDLSSYIFNLEDVQEFISALGTPGMKIPKILIEVEFYENEQTAKFKGINNSRRADAPGISLAAELDQQYAEDFKHYISNPAEVTSVPTEFYSITWEYFNGNPVSARGNSLRSTYIDASSMRFSSGSDKFINRIINEALGEKDKAKLALEYRKLRLSFSDINEVKAINASLGEKGKTVTSKAFKVSVDVSSRSAWDSALIPYLDELPFLYIGMGEQSKLKIGFALSAARDKTSVFLIEEPENHLSFSNMASLIERISLLCEDRQVVIATHSNFVLNKLGVDHVHLLKDMATLRLSDLSPSTAAYFKKLPGYDTLRLLLAKRVILVEGPTEELMVQRAFVDRYGSLPIANGIDVISVRGLSFKRFLEISKILNIETRVVTDNDGDIEAVKAKYREFESAPSIKVYYPNDPLISTFEIAMSECNSLANFCAAIGATYSSKSELLKYLLGNKTEWALKAFETAQNLSYPDYISDAIS